MPNKKKETQARFSSQKDPDHSPATLEELPGTHHGTNSEIREPPHLQASSSSSSSSSATLPDQGTTPQPSNTAKEGRDAIRNKVEQVPGSAPSSSNTTPSPLQRANRTHRPPEHLTSFGYGSCAERTRSKNRNPSINLDRGDWEAIFLAEEKKKEETLTKKAGKSGDPEGLGGAGGTGKAKVAEASREVDATDLATKQKMSRNPRGAPTGDNAEEVNLWNKIIHQVTRAKELNDKQKDLGQQIITLDEKIAKEGSKPTLAELNQLDDWHQQLLKLSEQEKKILSEEPSSAISNLKLLIVLQRPSMFR